MTDAEILAAARILVAKQAEDEGLWLDCNTVTEAHLQAALRDLARVIETNVNGIGFFDDWPDSEQ